MIEKFVINKINQEHRIFEDLWGSLPIDEKLTQEKISKSSLSEFTKNYIVNVVDESGDRDEILDRIAKANKLRFNYAIRPKWTLITYLFGNYESRPPTDISKKLDLFPFYNFYIDSINEVLRDNFSIFITRNEVSMIIDETNKAIYRKLTTDINNAKIKNFFLQIYSLKYNEQELNLESTIPYSFIRLFLNDKYYFDIEKKFQLVKGISDEYEISLKDVIKVLMNKYDFNEIEPQESVTLEDSGKPTSDDSPGQTPDQSSSPTILKFPSQTDKTNVKTAETIVFEDADKDLDTGPDVESKTESKSVPPSESIDESKSEPGSEPKEELSTDIPIEEKPEPVDDLKLNNVVEVESLSKTVEEPEIEQKPEVKSRDESKVVRKMKHLIQFRQDSKDKKKVESKVEPETTPINTSAKGMNEEMDREDKDVLIEEEKEPVAEEPSSTIKKLFTEKQFDKILERVYKSDIEQTARSFMKLSNYKTWFEASNHLKSVFKNNEVDIYNKDVINFVDTLNDYFSERG
jgi:hypothetical protein